MFQTKDLDESPETILNETKISDLLNKEFKIKALKMITKVRRAMHEQSKAFNKEMKYIKIT